ncbi:glycosyltransferase family 2 protein [Yoonia vestfoldensis]|uniref:glycosyltransferase family 2 protein n=1 Tax=Yoonia vestfoldensis TaxID=245188 RepID=UPI0003785F66|nr:glycosyltransferase family 2 protein [Yoonia vestfoldensis]
MKDEGPFILEWIAHYLALGFDHFIINSNDCSDGTDLILQRLQELGIVTHIDNPGPWAFGPQASAYQNAMAHPKFAEAEWVLVCDADEFLDIKVGDRTVDALIATAPRTDVFALVWRLFGHNGIVRFEDRFITDQMTMAAAERQIWPPQVRAIKSLVRMNRKYREISTHRPKRLRPRFAGRVRWTDGDGQPMPGFDFQGWMFNHAGIGFGTANARMNHYAVRSIESYLVKRMRGDVNTTSFHGKMEETGQRYWQLHCWNVAEDLSILGTRDRRQAQYDRLRADPTLAQLHDGAVAIHRARITVLNKTQQAIDFTRQYTNYSTSKVTLLADEALSDPRMTINRQHFDPATFLQACQLARLDDMRVRLGAGRLPWFANMDALETVRDREIATQIVAAYHSEKPSFAALPPLPDDVIAAVDAPQPDRTPRAIRSSKARQRFLNGISGKNRTTWLLVGASDGDVLDDLLQRLEIETLFVIEPWGIRPTEMVVDTPETDDSRKALDTVYLATVLRHQVAIKTGRLRIFRSLPQWIVRLLDDATLDVCFVNGARKPRATQVLLDQLAPKLKPAGLIVVNSYRAADTRGRGTIEAIHNFVGAASATWRIMAVEDGHIAMELLEKTDD